MKKIIIGLIAISLLMTGCGIKNQTSITNELKKKINNYNSYQLTGNLSVNNNDDIYNYDVEVKYKKDDYYKVTLINTSNDYKQIILKNPEGVFVITPSLNKSFKFQSDWPNNTSQIYLLKALLNDIEKDKKSTFTKKDNSYTYKTKVNYPNNSKLSYQKIIFTDKLKLKKVIVYDKNDIDNMTFSVVNFKINPKLSNKDFELDKVIKTKKAEKSSQTSQLEDVIYPLLLPTGTKLIEEEKIQKDNGERVIMTYDGEKSFLLVEETAEVFNDFTIIPTSGEPYQLMDTLGVMTSNSLSWTSGNVEYYIVSEVLSKDEMVEIAQSITGVASLK